MEKAQQEKAAQSKGPTINWSRELMASVVVFLVALPLCMGIALASGVPPALGLISGIVGGLVVGSLAGAPLLVSGPAAGLAVIIFELVQKHGLATLGIIVLIAGFIQVIAGWLKLGRWFRAVSPAVIHGMLAGIGILIFGSQFHLMVDDKPRANGIANLLSVPESIYKGLFPLDGSVHHLAAVVGIATILVLVLWNVFRPKKLHFLPAPLLAVIVGSGVAAYFTMPIKYVSIPSNLLSAANFPSISNLSSFLNPSILFAAVGVAVVASAESLLSATATDKLHQGPRANYDRELMAQGVGNMVCGFFGALPLTGVIVRSSANIEAGAESRYSGIFHGLWLLAFIIALPFVMQMIPTSTLAAVLVYIGYKLVNPREIKEIWKASRSEFGIYIITVVSIVSIDLLSGIIIGMCLSLAKLLYVFSHLKIEVKSDPEANRYDISVEGAATFIRLPQLAETLDKLPLDSEIHIHTLHLDYIDHACIDLLASWTEQMETSGGKLVVEWETLHQQFKSNSSQKIGEAATQES